MDDMTYEMSPRVSGGLGLEKARTLQGVGLGLGHHSPPTLYSLIGDFGKSPILSPPLLYICCVFRTYCYKSNFLCNVTIQTPTLGFLY